MFFASYISTYNLHLHLQHTMTYVLQIKEGVSTTAASCDTVADMAESYFNSQLGDGGKAEMIRQRNRRYGLSKKEILVSKDWGL